MKRLPLLILASAILACSCSDNEAAPPPAPDGNTTPTMITDSVNSFVSDSGITRYQLIAPTWLMFDEADEPYWLFPQGMRLNRFDNRMEINAAITADTARFFSRTKIWKLDGNVRMRNINGDKFLTRQLFWDQRAHKVYSDSFIHIQRAERILEGYGFTSNEEITAYTIRRPTGIIPTDGFRHPQHPDPALAPKQTTPE